MQKVSRGFGQVDLPLSPYYREFIQYAGTSGALAEYDEENHTMKVVFTETPAFHKITNRTPADCDMGTAKFALILQKPDQLRALAKQLLACAEAFDWLLDPSFEYYEEFMGRKAFP